jgi:acyl-coenzyme A thioesterase 13
MGVPGGFSPFPEQGPFLEHIGPVLVGEGDELVIGLLAEERHANRSGTVMGGLLATLADFAVGRAIGAESEDDRARATASLTVDFLRPAQPGDWIEARTRVEQVGGKLAFADCSLVVGDREVVRARAVFAVT